MHRDNNASRPKIISSVVRTRMRIGFFSNHRRFFFFFFLSNSVGCLPRICITLHSAPTVRIGWWCEGGGLKASAGARTTILHFNILYYYIPRASDKACDKISSNPSRRSRARDTLGCHNIVLRPRRQRRLAPRTKFSARVRWLCLAHRVRRPGGDCCMKRRWLEPASHCDSRRIFPRNSWTVLLPQYYLPCKINNSAQCRPTLFSSLSNTRPLPRPLPLTLSPSPSHIIPLLSMLLRHLDFFKWHESNSIQLIRF